MFKLFYGYVLFCSMLIVPNQAIPSTNVNWKPDAFQRGAEQTYLTFPEWFLVFSPAEYAEFTQVKPPHEFPFLAHIDQFWESYALVTKKTEKFPYNEEYHTMINVIGWSTAIEYWVKYAYEKTLGHLSWWMTGKRTIQDDYISNAAQLYVDAIYIRPWYEFDFFGYIPAIWRQFGERKAWSIRGVERACSFSVEYAVKGVYGKVIAWLAASSYEQPSIYTAVQTKKELNIMQVNALQECSVTQVDEKLYLFKRYQEFTSCLVAMGEAGLEVEFESIVGNKGKILLSITGRNIRKHGVWESIASFPILTRPGEYRNLVVANISQLQDVLKIAKKDFVFVEHVFDF